MKKGLYHPDLDEFLIISVCVLEDADNKIEFAKEKRAITSPSGRVQPMQRSGGLYTLTVSFESSV